jgi:hypothetical protein
VVEDRYAVARAQNRLAADALVIQQYPVDAVAVLDLPEAGLRPDAAMMPRHAAFVDDKLIARVAAYGKNQVSQSDDLAWLGALQDSQSHNTAPFNPCCTLKPGLKNQSADFWTKDIPRQTRLLNLSSGLALRIPCRPAFVGMQHGAEIDFSPICANL